MSTSTVKLNVFHQGQLVQTREVAGPVVKIGRLGTSHLFLDDPQVARMHAVVEVNGDDVRIVDLGSATGTRVNGRPVARHEALRSGDALEIGPYAVTVEVARAIARRPDVEPNAERNVELDVSPFEDIEAPPVTEVIGMYGRTVLDVAHVAPVSPKRRWPLAAIGLGGAAMLIGLALFAHDATVDWETWRAEATQAAEAGRPVPDAPGWGLGGLGVALMMLGLVPLVAGISARLEHTPTDYIVGEHPDASFHADVGIAGGLSLVADGRLSFTADMAGCIYTGGASYRLDDLVADGKARSDGATFSVPLPADARCRLERGSLVFYVNSVPPGRATAGRNALDKPFWIHSGVSALALGGVLAMIQLVPGDDMDMSLEESMRGNRFVGYMHQPDEPEEPVPTEVDHKEVDEGLHSEAGQRADAAEGKMGDPRQRAAQRQYRVQGPRDAKPMIGRNFSPDVEARQGGVLGVIESSSAHWLADASGGEYTIGNHDEDVWGNLVGTDVGAANGMLGLGVVGTGRGGGGTAEGTIGFGNVGTIGSMRRDGGGQRLEYGRQKGVAHANRRGRTPSPRVAVSKPLCQGGCLDKDVIRRVVRAHINEVRHCYNEGLTRDPGLRGRVAVQFRIAQNGKVQLAAVAESSLGDARVGTCIAKAARRWRFPTSQASSIVTYPFVLAPAS